MSERLLHSDELEKSVLAIALWQPETVPKILEQPAELFATVGCQTIHGVLLDMRRKGETIDRETVAHRLSATDLPPRFLPEVTEKYAGTALVLGQYLEDLHELHRKRRLRELAAVASGALGNNEDSFTIARDVQSNLAQILDSSSSAAPRLLSEFQAANVSPDDELLKHRFLCRGGGALITGPTGIGKSVMTTQAQMSWALGWNTFGIVPPRPLTNLLIQAENDDGDLAEMRDGVAHGLTLTAEETKRATANIRVECCDSYTGQDFFNRVVEPLVRRHKPDLLWIDPVLSYLGGDASSQKDVSAFLRQGLNPILHRHRCGAILIHHTNKPARGKEKAEYSGGDFAYLGSGSIEWANWARGVLAIQSVGAHDAYWLHAGKRGGRLGWTDDDGGRIFKKAIGHSQDGKLCWREIREDQMPGESPKGRPQKAGPDEILNLLNGKEKSFSELCKEAPGRISPKTVQRRLAELKAEGKAINDPVSGKWKRTK